MHALVRTLLVLRLNVHTGARCSHRDCSLEARRRQQAIHRAKCILESYHGVKVFPVGGKLVDVAQKKRCARPCAAC